MIGPEERWRRHVPTHPSYRCRACGVDRPCQHTRLALLASFRGDRLGLMVYLGSHLVRAPQELPDEHSALLAGRFLH